MVRHDHLVGLYFNPRVFWRRLELRSGVHKAQVGTLTVLLQIIICCPVYFSYEVSLRVIIEPQHASIHLTLHNYAVALFIARFGPKLPTETVIIIELLFFIVNSQSAGKWVFKRDLVL